MKVRARFTRVLRWALAVAALAFVAWVVPVRDRCWDPRSPATTRVAVTHRAAGCVLHLRSGDVEEPASECAQLACEPGAAASTSSRADAPVLLGLLGLYGLGYLAWAARWRALLSFAGIDMSLGQVWRVSIEAQAGGVLLPGGIGGDALRIAAVVSRPTRAGEVRAPAAIVVAAGLLDRALGLSVIAALAAVLGLGFGGLRDGALAFVLAAIPVGVAAALWILRVAPLERVAWLSRGRLPEASSPPSSST